jgi:alpha-ketoglutarate-dependent taurine dioxygenase
MERDQTFSSGRFAAIRPKPVRLSPTDLVRTSFLAGGALPLVMEPAADGVDLRAWAGANRDYVTPLLRKHGGILFRNFTVPSLVEYEEIARSLCREVIEYGERSSPRTRLAGRIYTSTDHPPDQPIRLHNEQSYTLNWPMKILFHCVTPAATGGATPIADCRRIYERLDPVLLEEFSRRQVLYVRNYGEGLGLSWQVAFQTSEPSVVEAHCRKAGIEWEWRAHCGLHTRQIRPAIRRHPESGEPLWFNHAVFFHFSSLSREAQASILEVLDRKDAPFDTFYGDGGIIEDATLEAIRQAYDAETVCFAWTKGDILMLDNMLVCHGRAPFTGARNIAVAMGDAVQSLPKREEL